MSPFKFGLKQNVTDNITKVEYVIIGRLEYTSYVQYYCQAVPTQQDSGKPQEPVWLDEDRLELTQ